MNVLEFAKTEMDRVAKFATWYNKNAMLYPKQYPKTMEPGEWDEKYLSWEPYDD